MNPVLTAGLIAFAALLALGAGAHSAMTTPRRVGTARRRRSRVAIVRRRGHGGEVEVAAWCERVTTGVRAGSSLTRAVIDADTATEPWRRPFPGVAHALARGRRLADALDPMAEGPGAPAGLLAPVLTAAAELGGPAAPALQRVTDTLLARAADRDERRAASAQARLSARVLTTMPFGVLAILLLAEPAVRRVLATPAGLTCVAAGSALNLLGWWWMRRMIGGAA